MSEVFSLYESITMISPIPPSPAATPAEQKARRLLSLHTPSDTDEALQMLRNMGNQSRHAEWHFLMGVCALRRGHVVDAQAHFDRACMLSAADAEQEYRALYESVRNVFEKKKADEDRDAREHACFSGADCWDCCECLYCCDCDGSDGCCDCCDCSDGCN